MNNPASNKYTKTALRYQSNGFSVIPIKTDGTKRPAVEWKEYQSRPATKSEIRGWFENGHEGLGVVCGKVSGGLVVLDFDHDAEKVFSDWRERVSAEDPDIFNKLMIVQTPRPGVHVWFRQEGAVCRNLKLATDVDGTTTLIETRGEGGYVVAPGGSALVHPERKQYDVKDGKVSSLPALSEDEADLLFSICADLNRQKPPPDLSGPPSPPYQGPPRPGDLYNDHEDIMPLLLNAGWTISHEDDHGVIHLVRPGKKTPGSSATVGHVRDENGRPLLYVFSSDASPFEQEKTYRPFDVLCLTVHAGDYSAAASEARDLYAKELADASAAYEADSQTDAKSSEVSASVINADYQPFPLDCFPETVRNYIKGHAEAINIDPAFVGVPLLSVLAAAVGGSRGLSLKSTWFEPAILWTATIAPVSSGKSPAWNAAIAPLKKIEAELNNTRETKEANYLKQLEKYEQALAAGDTDAKKPSEPGFTPQVLVDDTTMEALAELTLNNDKLLVSIDELAGWARQMNQYRAGRDVENWLHFYNGAAISINRKLGKKRLYVERTCICLTGNTQCRIADEVLFDQASVDNGLASRILFARPPSGLVRWSDKEVDPSVIAEMNALVERIYLLRGEKLPGNRKESPISLGFSADARSCFTKWFNEFRDRAESLPEVLKSRLVKLQPAAGRIALVLSVTKQMIEDPNGTAIGLVDRQSVEAGITLAEWFGHELVRTCKTSPHNQLRSHLIWILKRHPEGCDHRTLQIGRRAITSADQAREVLTHLSNQGYGQLVDDVFKPDWGSEQTQKLWQAEQGGEL